MTARARYGCKPPLTRRPRTDDQSYRKSRSERFLRGLPARVDGWGIGGSTPAVATTRPNLLKNTADYRTESLPGVSPSVAHADQLSDGFISNAREALPETGNMVNGDAPNR